MFRWLLAHLPHSAYRIRPLARVMAAWQWRELNKPHGFTQQEIDDLTGAIEDD